MGAITRIAWCDATFNPWVGCLRVSTACDRWEYGDGAYTAKAAGDEIAFEAETESPKYGKLQWKGVVRGAKLDGTLTMIRGGKAAGEKWVVAGEKS